MVDINWKCNKCGQDLVMDSKYAGTKVECPKCNKSLVVPSNRFLQREKKLVEPKNILQTRF